MEDGTTPWERRGPPYRPPQCSPDLKRLEQSLKTVLGPTSVCKTRLVPGLVQPRSTPLLSRDSLTSLWGCHVLLFGSDLVEFFAPTVNHPGTLRPTYWHTTTSRTTVDERTNLGRAKLWETSTTKGQELGYRHGPRYLKVPRVTRGKEGRAQKSP